MVRQIPSSDAHSGPSVPDQEAHFQITPLHFTSWMPYFIFHISHFAFHAFYIHFPPEAPDPGDLARKHSTGLVVTPLLAHKIFEPRCSIGPVRIPNCCYLCAPTLPPSPALARGARVPGKTSYRRRIDFFDGAAIKFSPVSVCASSAQNRW